MPNSLHRRRPIPKGRLGSRYFRGTGTSRRRRSSPGAVALVLQKYPNLTPDQVKRFITAQRGSRLPEPTPRRRAPARSQLDLDGSCKTPPAYAQKFTDSTGTGSLELARGTDHMTDDGVVLTGEKDIFGKPFNSAALATAEAAGSSWSGGAWNGSTWSGSTWSGNTWSGSTWSGNSWSRQHLVGQHLVRQQLVGQQLERQQLVGQQLERSWSGNTWSGGSWKGATWD